MLELIICLKEQDAAFVICRRVKGSVSEILHEGEAYTLDMSSIVRKYGRCMMIAYWGPKISIINKTLDPLLAREITESSNFLWNESSCQSDSLLFIHVNDLSYIRSCMHKAGVVVLQEHLTDKPEEISIPPLRIQSLPDEKLFRLILQKIKDRLLLLSSVILLMVSISYYISQRFVKEIDTINMDIVKMRQKAGKAEVESRNLGKLYSIMEPQLNSNAIYALDKMVVEMPSDIKLSSMEALGDMLKIEGHFSSSDDLSFFIRSVRKKELTRDVETSRIETDSKGNRLFTLKLWLD